MTRFYHSPVHSHRSSSVRISFVHFLAPLLLAFLLPSCEEEPTTLGKGLLPDNDFVEMESTDTLSLFSYTMYDDSVRTENPPTGYMGQIWDPYFGTTEASFVTQLRLKQDWPGKPYFIDSVKLILSISSAKGALTGNHTLSIYEIAEYLRTDTVYYSNKKVPHTGFKLENIPFPTITSDTVIAIKLPDVSFANRIMDDTSRLFHSNLVPDFRSYFKGLHFKLNSVGSPLMVTVGLANDNEGFQIMDRSYKNFFVIYYSRPETPQTAYAYYLMIDAVNRNASFNVVTHNFEAADPDKKITGYNKFRRDTLTYLQYLYGLYTRISIPGLEDIKTDPDFDSIAINKARLTIPYYSDDNIYSDANTPVMLLLRYRTTTGNTYYVHDYVADASGSFYGGTVDTINHVYNFNLATFVQKYLGDTKNEIRPEIEMFQSSGTRNLILRANASKKPPTLKLTFTRF